jgi:hypothetical protein
MRKLLLQHNRAPGDVLVMSALVRDIALAYPGQYQISVETSVGEIWRHNPHVIPTPKGDVQQDIEIHKLGYGQAINLVGSRNKHFLLGFYEDFERRFGVHVPLLYPRPDYHLSDEEKQTPLVSGRYWVMISGGKSDFITKHWVYKRSQQLVNVLRQASIYTVQVGAIGSSGEVYHYHPRLENTLCLVGLTTVRDMARLIYHAEGVICPVTAAMHFAAALQKPCVVIAGGREEWWWEAYVPGLNNFGTELREDVKVPHRFIHTIGKLDCCQRRGCWKNTVDTGPNCCRYPLDIGGQQAPACMDLITVNHVFEAVMSYYEEGTLPPIGHPKTIALVNGKPRVLQPGEVITDQHPSALVDALTYPEPQLLVKTAGIHVIEVAAT